MEYFSHTRSISPEDTLERITPFLADFGVTRVANITGLDSIGIPVYISHRPNSKFLSMSQGKGITHAAAKVSALMESIESYHAENINKSLISGSYKELSSYAKVTNPEDLASYKDYYFDQNDKFLWIQGKDLITEENIFVPYELVHTNAVFPLPPCHGKFFRSTNGLASGNNITEAILHGTFEVIERDSYSCWFLREKKEKAQTKVLLETISDSVCNELIQKIQSAGNSIAVWDITSDLDVPAYLVRILSNERPPHFLVQPTSGMGCHLNKDIALARALTEAAQSRLTFISGARDDIQPTSYKNKLSEKEYKKWYSAINEEKPVVDFSKRRSIPAGNLSVNIRTLKNILVNNNIKGLHVVDLSKNLAEISVVRVIIPGLEPADNYIKSKPGTRALAQLSEEIKTERLVNV